VTGNNEARPWWKNPIIIVPSIIALIAAILGGVLGSCLNRDPPDFSVCVEPLNGTVHAGGILQPAVTVNGFNGYKYDVSLSVINQPPNVVVTLNPSIGGPKPTYTSNMMISVGLTVPPDQYTLEIIGTGNDGLKKSCEYNLVVLPPAQSPEEPEEPEDQPEPSQEPEPTEEPEIILNIDPEEGEQITVSLSAQGLRPDSEYMLTLNGKIGQAGNEELKVFGVRDGQGVYDFMRARTDSQGRISASCELDDLEPGRYDVTILVKETWDDWTPVYIGDHFIFTVTSPSSLTITHPSNYDYVDLQEIVTGTSQNIDTGQVIWVLIYPHAAGRYYPQDEPADVQANGDWSTLVYFGTAADVGLKFDVIAVLANEEAQTAFNKYLEECIENQSWPGLEELPIGAVQYGFSRDLVRR
jgi:hypothetical protein